MIGEQATTEQPAPEDVLSAAVAADLNAAGLTHDGQPVTAEVHHVVDLELRDLATPRVIVVPRATERWALSRATDQLDVGIDVAVVARCRPEQSEAVGSLLALAAVAERAMNRRRPTGTDARWMASQRDPLYDPVALRMHRKFVAVLSLMYYVTEQVR